MFEINNLTLGIGNKNDTGLAYFDQYIRMYHECEDGIEKSLQRITVCHHEAS